MCLTKKHVSTTLAPRAILGLLFLFVSEQARSEPLAVRSFEFAYAAGRIEKIIEIGSTSPSAETSARLQTRYPAIGDVQLYCTPFSGPRLANIGGNVYKLNSQARRKGAYVITDKGRKELLDIDLPPSPIAGDFLMILKLVQDAGQAC